MPTHQIALVTGASSGIGVEIARALAARGFDLILTARRQAELMALAADLTRSHSITCHVFPADLADPDAPRMLFDQIHAKSLAIDVLVNNAGFGDLGAFADADLAKMLRMVQVNVTALVELTGLFLPGMRARGQGRLLNVGSVAGFQPGPMMAVYYATKAFVNSFSEALTHEFRGHGITVTLLAPGPTKSEFAAHLANKGMDTRTVAEIGVRAMLKGKRLVIPGWRNKLLIFAERFVPRGMVQRAVLKLQLRRNADSCS